MRTYVVIVCLLMVAALLGFFAVNSYIYDVKQGGAEDYKGITIFIEGKPVTLIGGRAEELIGDSVARVVTRYFGNNAKGDLNGDSIVDLAYLVTQETGGSGTFFYVVAALQNSAGQYIGSNTVLLGDRIAPQTTEIRNGTLIVTYATRTEGQPMTAAPSLGVSKYLRMVGERLEEIPQP